MASVGKHIRQLRTARHLTQEQLAETLFVTRQTVSAWETGKAQPDLETLERIAAALDTEVTAVIYGAPRSPDLGPLKRRWALMGARLVTILAIILIILLENGTYGTWRHGLAYQFTNADYALTYEEIPGSRTLELDLTDLESNVGKVLYEDDTGCRILVDAVDENRSGEYQVWFRSHGVYDRAGGDLVSGCQSQPVDKNTWSPDLSAALTVSADGRDLPCTAAGYSGLIYRDGNFFGFHLNPRAPDTGDRVSLEDRDTVTVTVSGLTRFSTRRTSYWGPY